jgi:hypothetical protein
MDWNSFRHNEPPARVSPRRFGGSNFPRPNTWRGDLGRFDYGRWSGGQWRHVLHNGRLGWWWVVGLDWYLFDRPIYPMPDLYGPAGHAPGWWYWCDPYQEYYPFVTYCPIPWQPVLPRE